jgi:hypothetical protein
VLEALQAGGRVHVNPGNGRRRGGE